MAISIEDLTTPVTREEVEASIYDVLATLGVSTTSWKPGAVVRTMIVACSIVLSAFSKLQALIARSGFLELASGDWLTLVARYVYGVEREEATFASGEITLTNAGGGTYSLDPDDLIFANPITGKTYRNSASVSIGALSTATVAIRATEAGSSSSSGAEAITVLETTLSGVTVSNALAVVGQDAESDPALRTRCAEKLGALSPMGPWDAYAYAARNAKNAGVPIGVNRVRTIKDGYGNTTTYVATAAGEVTGTVGDLATDLGCVDEAIQQAAAPLAVNATTVSATPIVVPVTYELWIYNTTGLTQAQILELVETRLLGFVPTQPIGGNVITPDPGKVFVDAIKTTIGATRTTNDVPLPIFHVVVTAPAADVELSSSQVAVLGTVSCTAVHQVAPPDSFT